MKIVTVIWIVFIVSILASAKAHSADIQYWKPDALYKPESRIEIDISKYANAWCGSKYQVWGCAMRIWKSYDYDGTERPAKCVIIISDKLSEADRQRAIAHEKCHCAGFDHPDNYRHGEFHPCPVPIS